MKLYTYYDKDDHPIAEAPTVSGLARKIGVSPSAVCKGLRKGSRTTARIKIPIDRLPDAPDPTLPHRDQEEKISSFAMSWSEEQHRKRVDASERQKKWRRKHDGA